MAVIVHQNEDVDSALRRLYREVVREHILEEYKDRLYRIKDSELEIEKRRLWKKIKRRKRSQARREKNK